MNYFCILLFSLIINTSLNSMQKSTWYLETTFEQPGSNVRVVAFNHDGTQLAISAGDMKSHIFDIKTKKELNTFDNDHTIARAICFNHQSNHIATGADHHVAYTFNLTTKEKSAPFNGKNIIKAIAFNHAGNQLAIGAHHTVRIFSLTENKHVGSIHHNKPIVDLCFDSTDTHIITTTIDKVRVFDIETKQKIKSFKRLEQRILSVLFNDHNEILTIEIPNQTIQIFNTSTNQTTDTKIKNYTDLHSVSLHPTIQQLALGRYGQARIYINHIKPITALWALKNFTNHGIPLPNELIYQLIKPMLALNYKHC